MKRISYYSALFAIVSVLVTSCAPTSFDETLLIGKWGVVNETDTLFYRYDNDGTGATWDTADDVTEAEAQTFSWTLDQSDFIHIHDMESDDSKITKIYTMTTLTATTLEYEDSFSKFFSFKKMQ